MACATQIQNRKKAEDLPHIRRLAIAFSDSVQNDVFIEKTGKEYKFYEVGTKKPEGGIIEYICRKR